MMLAALFDVCMEYLFCCGCFGDCGWLFMTFVSTSTSGCLFVVPGSLEVRGFWLLRIYILRG